MDDYQNFSQLDPLNEDHFGLFGNEDENANVNDGNEWPEGTETTPSATGRVVEAKPKRAVRNPRLRLTADTLRGPRGIQTIEQFYKDVKFKGKGHEQHDLNETLSRLQHWAHRMFPSIKFEDVLTTVETLGKKKQVQLHMSRYRLGQLEDDAIHGIPEHKDDHDNEVVNKNTDIEEPFDELDALLGEQIAISMLNTPHHASRNNTSSLNE